MNQPSTLELPELSDADIDRIEHEVFARIAADDAPPRKTRSKRRAWLTAGGVAAAFVAGVIVAPPLLSAVNQPSMDMASDMPPTSSGIGWTSAEGGSPEIGQVVPGSEIAVDSAIGEEGREIIASAHASVRVDEIVVASEAIAAIAADHGGYVESTNIGERGYIADASMPVPPGGDYGWITIRVPSESLTETLAELSEVGDVVSSSTAKQDVTSVAIDLRARVDATRASVQRLTELMAQTATVSELIEAEVALSERQAQLESYEQQLAALDEQIAMSSVSVELTRIRPVTSPEPAGFGDGLTAGWNGLIVSLNALVVAAGFVLPWLAVAGVAVLIVWLIIRARRGRTRADATQP